ncbi:myelin regulatory factor-like protein [Striga asiatica]|uniref:Myelin regulatory factor-like protein n=1 Tax=Striga asiatica TaxID=4170 RepID=A0A5A7PS82_STRAF|nr:myelin regulatory factor-like protein [Striga asiatica]
MCIDEREQTLPITATIEREQTTKFLNRIAFTAYYECVNLFMVREAADVNFDDGPGDTVYEPIEFDDSDAHEFGDQPGATIHYPINLEVEAGRNIYNPIELDEDEPKEDPTWKWLLTWKRRKKFKSSTISMLARLFPICSYFPSSLLNSGTPKFPRFTGKLTSAGDFPAIYTRFQQVLSSSGDSLQDSRLNTTVSLPLLFSSPPANPTVSLLFSSGESTSDDDFPTRASRPSRCGSLIYQHTANASRPCLESGNTDVQGYLVAPHIQRLGGYNVGQPRPRRVLGDPQREGDSVLGINMSHGYIGISKIKRNNQMSRVAGLEVLGTLFMPNDNFAQHRYEEIDIKSQY